MNFVSEELAKKLKTIGFNKPCSKFIYHGNTGTNKDVVQEVVPSESGNWNEVDMCTSIPTFDTVEEWMVEKNFAINVTPVGKKWEWTAFMLDKPISNSDSFQVEYEPFYYDSRFEALSRAIDQIILKF